MRALRIKEARISCGGKQLAIAKLEERSSKGYNKC
jgi:hypothetical protein